MTSSSRLTVLLVSIGIVLSPFTDFPLQSTALGFLAANPAFLPLLVLISAKLVYFLIGRGRVKLNFIIISVWFVVISVYGLIQFGSSFLGQSMVDKGIRLAILLALFLIPIYLTPTHLFIRMAYPTAFVLTIIGVFVVDIWGYSNLLHATPNLNMRPRGFTLESSHLSIILIATGFGAMHVVQSWLVKLTIAGVMITGLIFAGSKGGIAVLVGGVILLVISYLVRAVMLKRVHKVTLVMIPLLMLASLGLGSLSQSVVKSLTMDVTEYTSSATRATLAIAAIQIALQHPFGVGFTGYLPALVKNIPFAISTLAHLYPVPLNFGEVATYTVADSDRDISTKSFFFDGLILFGFPFVLVYIWFSIRLLVKLLAQKKWLLLMGVAAVLAGLMFFSTGLGIYTLSFFLGLAYAETRHSSVWSTLYVGKS